MRKKILIILIMVICLYADSTYALMFNGCESSKISRLRSIVSNINISYNYHIQDNNATFDITLTNLTPDIYVVDTSTNNTYSEFPNGELTISNYSSDITPEGQYKFYSKINECSDTLIGTKYYNLPSYNKYAIDPVCRDVSNYYKCNRWYKTNENHDTFVNSVQKYKDSLKSESSDNDFNSKYNNDLINKILTIYAKYYFYLLVGIILICGGIILIKNRKDRFKL